MNNEKGNIAVIAVLIALILLAGGAAAYIVIKGTALQKNKALSPAAQQPQALTAATSTPDETADWKTYRNDKYGFEMRYPLDWQEQLYGDGIAFLSASTIEYYKQGVYTDIIPDIGISILSNPDNGPIEEIRKDWYASYPTKEKITIDGHSAIRYDTTTSEPPAVLIDNGKTSIVVGLYRKEDDRNKQIFDQALSTFKFTDETSRLLNQKTQTPPTATSSDDIADWKTYTNKQYQFEFKYPSVWISQPLGEFDGKNTVEKNIYSGEPITGQYFNLGFKIDNDIYIDFEIASYSPDYNGFEFQPEGFYLGLDARTTAKQQGGGTVEELALADGSKGYIALISFPQMEGVDCGVNGSPVAYVDVPAYLHQPYKIYAAEFTDPRLACNASEGPKAMTLLKKILSTFTFLK